MPSNSILSDSITSITIYSDDSIGSSPFFHCNDNNNNDESTTPDKRSSSSLYCRICHEDSSNEELIDPCECSGTLALIHTSCLEKWLSASNTEHCEICKHRFYIQKKSKPIYKSVWQWWKSKNVQGARSIAGDAICLIMLTPLCVVATYLCGIGASAYAKLGFWEGTGLAILCCMLVATYCLWFFVTVRFHYKSLQDWRQGHQDIKLLIKHCSEAERKEARLPFGKTATGRLQDLNNRQMLTMMRPRVNRFAAWFGTNFSHGNDPFFVIQQTTFV